MIIGLLRVKNEALWIERVIRSIQPICEHVLVLDDHSRDKTPEICADLGVTVFRSEFAGIDESRDKDWLLSKAYELVPDKYKLGNAKSPYWGLMIDGDEELVQSDQETLRALTETPGAQAFSLRVLYLWNSSDLVRVDGVYRNFRRPSMFRMINQAFRFQRTTHGRRVTPDGMTCANLHCSSIPQEMVRHTRPAEARLLHYGYLRGVDRLRKYEWYNLMDPNNVAEDMYRHMVVGDTFPETAKFKHGGPLQLEALEL